MRNPLFHEKIEFCETWWKEVYTLFAIESCFRVYVQQLKISLNTMKKVLCVHQRTTYSSERVRENGFTKCSQIITNYSLHIIRISHKFCLFVHFRHYSWIVYSGLYIYSVFSVCWKVENFIEGETNGRTIRRERYTFIYRWKRRRIGRFYFTVYHKQFHRIEVQDPRT